MPAHITDGNTVQESTPVRAPVPDSTPVIEHALLLKGHVLLTDQWVLAPKTANEPSDDSQSRVTSTKLKLLSYGSP